MDNNPTQMFVPTLHEFATTNDQKANAFQETLFGQPPSADLSDISKSKYPEAVEYTAHITMRQIPTAITKLATNKASGPGEISNRVLKEILQTIQHHLQALMQASLSIGHFPKPYKHTTTIALRKSGKSDYTKAKAYRPIALENTLRKVMESIMADVISYLTETYELLTTRYYGGRPGRSAEDALMTLSESIHKAWKEKEIYMAVLAGAFNNVHHERFIYNIKKWRIPTIIAEWTRSFLQDRNTQLLFNGTRYGSRAEPCSQTRVREQSWRVPSEPNRAKSFSIEPSQCLCSLGASRTALCDREFSRAEPAARSQNPINARGCSRTLSKLIRCTVGSHNV